MSPHESQEPLDALPMPPQELPAAEQPVLLETAASDSGPSYSVSELSQIPRPPSPSLLGAIGWSLLYLLVIILMTQVGSLLGIIHILITSPDGAQIVKAVVAADRAEMFGEQTPSPSVSKDQIVTGKSIMQGWAIGTGQGSAILFAWFLLRFRIGTSWRRVVALQAPSPMHLGLTLLSFPGFVVLPSFVHLLVRHLLPKLSFGYQEDVEKLVLGMPVGLGILIVAAGPGIAEEFFCRGFLGRGLLGRYGALCGIVLTSCFFGVLHLDPPHVVATFVMGMALHYVYFMSRSLWLPIMLHFLNNSLSVLAAHGMLGALGPAGSDAPSPWLALVSMGLWVAIAWAFYESRSRLVSTPDIPEPNVWQPPYATVAHPPAGSGTVVTRSWPSAYSLAAVAALFGAWIFVLYWEAVHSLS